MILLLMMLNVAPEGRAILTGYVRVAIVIVAKQMTSNMVVAMRDVCKCVLLASQIELAAVSLVPSAPTQLLSLDLWGC